MERVVFVRIPTRLVRCSFQIRRICGSVLCGLSDRSRYLDEIRHAQSNFSSFSLFLKHYSNATGTIRTVVGSGTTAGTAGNGGAGTSAQMNNPQGIKSYGGMLYWAEQGSHIVRRFNLSSGIVNLYAGMPGSAGSTGDNGTATSAKFSAPQDVAINPNGTVMLVADSSNHAIRRIDMVSMNVTTIAGTLASSGTTGDNGPATAAKLNTPRAVVWDPSGTSFYISDSVNCVVRKVSLAASGNNITRYAGSGTCGYSGDGGSALSANLAATRGLAVAANGDLYIGDAGNRVRKVSASTGLIELVAGGGTSLPESVPASWAAIREVRHISLDKDNNLFIADPTSNKVHVVLGSTCATT